jgi:tetratricopeptide (TPR) repeat protein
MLPSSVVIEEWRLRLDDLLRQKRFSEVEHLHDWMDIAFGREPNDQPQPLDLRIHSRLADLYLKSQNYGRAIQQLELARRLAPRDIFVLRHLGLALLESGDRDRAKSIIDQIGQLDEQAFVHNAECAALAGRWYREVGNLGKAAEMYAAALDANPDSYYLANVLAEVQLEAGATQAAQDAFHRALNIIERLRETNLWTHATSANARFFLGEDDTVRTHLGAINALGPSADDFATIQRGLEKVAGHLERGDERLQALLQELRG